jgi:hypothetical protein
MTEIIDHHRGTESTEKDFFDLPGDTGKSKYPVCPWQSRIIGDNLKHFHINYPVGETTGAAIKNSPEGMSLFYPIGISRLDKRNRAL